jgi:RNA polymerase sigma-70 factor (ECF subfamily)
MSEEDRAEREDRDLIRRITSKDAAALDAFYVRYNRLAFSLILRIVGDPADAEDVITDVFWQVWQQAPKFDAKRGKPVAWLLTIARSRAIDCLRSSNRHQVKADLLGLQELRSATVTEPDSFVAADKRRAVREALETLPEQQRLLLEMAYFQGMSHTEIAGSLGQPLGTVKDRIRTGMAHLRQRLKSYL